MKRSEISVPRPQRLQFASPFQRFVRRKTHKSLSVAIIIPTFKRAANLRRIIENVEAVTIGNYAIYFVIESDDTSTTEELATISDPRVKVIVNSGPKTYPGAINTAFCNTREPLFFCGSDDVRFYPEWLANAVQLMGKDVGVVGTNDLHHPEVLSGSTATHFLVKRNYIEKMGGVIGEKRTVLFNYHHNFSDTEFIETAKMRQMFKPCLSSVVEHEHWSFGKATMDETYEKSWSTFEVDRVIFSQRRRLWEEPV